MRYGLDVATDGEYANPRMLADLAAEAERAGWDGFFVWDVLYAENRTDKPIADPWIALAAIATSTQQIRLGALLTPLARRLPWDVARETATLDHLSNGRLIFGAGLGYQALEFTPFGQNADPKVRAEKLDEGLEVLTGLWTGEPFSFDGRHYRLRDAQLLPTPVQRPRIPVWIGGYWPNRKPFRRAARWDGLYPGTARADGEPFTLEDFREVVAYVCSHRETQAPFDIAVAGVTPPDLGQAAEIVRSYLEAGATWWIEVINDGVGPLDDMQRRIRLGPPRVDR